MGGIEGATEHGLMTAREIAAHLLACCSSLEKFDAYLFGSSLGGIGKDIDLLLVGPGGNALSQLKHELRAAGEALPLHALFMLPAEERHFEFVVREKCVPLKKLAALV